MNMVALWSRIDALAEDVGRLRRRAEPDSWNAHVLDRIAADILVIDSIASLSAAELVGCGIPVTKAVEAVDVHVARLHSLLAERRR